jgi:hypothetical protein
MNNEPLISAAVSDSDSGVDAENEIVADEFLDPELPPSNRLAVSSLGPLAQLKGEDSRAYCALISFASAVPMLSVSEFCRSFGYSRRTVTNWRDVYNWRDRIQQYQAARASRFVAVDMEAAAASVARREAAASNDADLRANAVELARTALNTWLSNADDLPLTLSGVVRALDFACKLNPTPASNASRENNPPMADFNFAQPDQNAILSKTEQDCAAIGKTGQS